MISRSARYLYGAIGGVVLFRVLRSGAFTFSQYLTWKRDEFSQFLLPPHQPLWYFLQYSWIHFWFSVVLTLGSAALFTGFLIIVRKYRPVLFASGEIEIAFLAAVIVGCPKVVIFIPLVFVVMTLMALYNHFRFPEFRTPLMPALVIAGVLAFFFGKTLIDFFGIGALAV